MTSIGFRIAQKRRSASLTQETLAEKLGVSAQAVSKWENNISCPDITLLPSLSKILGISIDELLTGETSEVALLPKEERKPLEQLTLRVRIFSANGDKVKINLPMLMVKLALEAGMDILPHVNGTDELGAMKNVKMEKIVEMVEHGMVGKILEVESADGENVEIVVE